MRSFGKFIVLALALLTLSLALSSCHGSYDIRNFEIPKEFDESRQYELSFWVKIDNNTSQLGIYSKAIEQFEKIYPNIKVKIRQFFNYGDIYKEVLTNISLGTTPNVCITYPDHIASYKTGENVVVPLDDLIDDKNYGLGGEKVKFDSVRKDEIFEKFLLEGVVDEKQYALPFMRSTEACYINEDLVKALGYTIPEDGILTWDFVFEVSRAAMKPVNYTEDGKPIYINGQSVMVPFVYKSTDNMMIQLLRQNGYDYSTDDGEILIFNDDTKKILYMVADNVASGAFSTFDIANAYPGDLLNSGKCIFGVDSTAGATWMGTNAPNVEIDRDTITDFNMVVTEIPQVDPENPTMISQGPSICLFNKDDPNEVLASWLFAQFLLTNDTQIAYSQTEGYVPVTNRARNSEAYVDYLSRGGEDNDLYYKVKIDAAKLLLDNIDNTFITPVFNGSASLRNAAGLMIEETGKAVNRKLEINDERFETIFKKVRSIYKLDEFGAEEGESKELGPMPTMSVVLLSSLGVIWLGIGLFAGVKFLRKRKEENKIRLNS